VDDRASLAIIADAASSTITNRSTSGELRPIDLSHEPDAAEV